MTSPFHGKWRLYGSENPAAFAQTFHIPKSIQQACAHLRPIEEVHVAGDHVTLRVEVPEFTIHGSTIEKNFTFGQSAKFPMITSEGEATGTVTKDSDCKWHAKLTCPDTGDLTVTREIINGEMWVTIDRSGKKLIHKFERIQGIPCPVTGVVAPQPCKLTVCPKTGTSETTCPVTGATTPCSPFQGSWALYGQEGVCEFFEALGVPEVVRCVMSHIRLYESIHVNGDKVHVRICVAPMTIPAKTLEMHAQFGHEFEFISPITNLAVKATSTKVSDTKWVAKMTIPKLGEVTKTREIVGEDMWITFETAKGKFIRKFEKCHGGHGHCQKKC